MPSELLVVAQQARRKVKRLADYVLNAFAHRLASAEELLDTLGWTRRPGVQLGLRVRKLQGMALAALTLPRTLQLYIKTPVEFPRPRGLLEVAEEVRRARQAQFSGSRSSRSENHGPRTQVSRAPKPGQGGVHGQIESP